ncbi:hypothetical protein [Psychromonas sp. SP041]|uniref:hypothetical protein n=1 Tax=Psychromonas sp. SP041 TaxID=1365007 RepID=UPI00047292D7|nr:hypothetical protein [Psychromonas sp. SP041]
MNNFNHRVGVNEENIVNRKLQLTGVNEQNYSFIYAEINKTFGVDRISIDLLSNKLDISYDATHINLITIENILSVHDISVTKNWWNRTKESYYKFVDQNIMEQKDHKEVCCHKPPIIPKKSKK